MCRYAAEAAADACIVLTLHALHAQPLAVIIAPSTHHVDTLSSPCAALRRGARHLFVPSFVPGQGSPMFQIASQPMPASYLSLALPRCNLSTAPQPHRPCGLFLLDSPVALLTPWCLRLPLRSSPPIDTTISASEYDVWSSCPAHQSRHMASSPSIALLEPQRYCTSTTALVPCENTRSPCTALPFGCTPFRSV